MHRIIATFLILLAGGLALVLPQSRAARAETLSIGISQFPSTLHPLIDAMLAKTYVLAMTQRNITSYDQDWRLVCLLCTELPTIENGGAVPETLADGKQGIAITYKLQPGATWGDGTPVTSADMVFTWEVGLHPKSGVANLEFFRRILAVEVIDAKTFVLHLDRIDYTYNSLPLDLLPAHLERPIFEADPAQYRNRTTYDTNPTHRGLAFGPYRLSELVSGSKLVLEANPTWWGKPPAFDRITVRVIENTAALEANLLSGGVDMIAGELGVTLDQALGFEKRHGDKYEILYKSGLIYEHIDLNLDNPILADARVRKALLHALDRETISQKLFEGRQPAAHASVSPLDWVHSETTPRYAYDPQRAAALLDEAGWSVLKKGIRHNAAGEALVLEIMTTAGNRSRELVQQVLQSQWRQIGIDMRIRNEPARVFFGETLSKRKFPALAMFAWISSPELLPRTTLSSDHIPTTENNWAGQNYTGFRNDRMDALIKAIEVELDREKRKALWAELQDLYVAELPALPLYWRANAYILPKWLRGVQPTGHQGTTTNWVENWHSEGR